MRIAVQDANVLIDLELAGLFDLWFQIGIETHTTSFIRDEIEQGGYVQTLAYFQSGHLKEHPLSFEEIAAVSALVEEVGSKAGFADCSVLLLAEKLKAILISGDKALRKAGRGKDIEVRGVLWIFDVLVERGMLAGEVAVAKLEHLRSLNRYLPAAECAERLERWGMRGRQTS